MSDSYITIVPIGVTNKQVTELSIKVIDWLTENGFVLNNLTDCVMSQNGGYPPGANYKEILDDGDVDLLMFKINGLEIIKKRQVFDNGQNGLEEINCPLCGANNIEGDWAEAIDSWHNGDDGKLNCYQCNKDSAITDYDFKPSWGFGEFGLTFWNWPGLKIEFLNDLKRILGSDIKIVHGKL